MYFLIDPVFIHVTDKNNLSSFKIILEFCWNVCFYTTISPNVSSFKIILEGCWNFYILNNDFPTYIFIWIKQCDFDTATVNASSESFSPIII